MTEIFQIARR